MPDTEVPTHAWHIEDREYRRQEERRGRRFAYTGLDPARTALVVVDMQNYYVAEGYPNESPNARAIAPNINRMAAALRAAGGRVVWVQTDSAQALARWGNHHKYKLTPENAARRPHAAPRPCG